jgi:hypothetical protein
VVAQSSFESISVWLLPPPVEQTAALNKALSQSDLSQGFKEQVQKLKHAIAEQIKVGVVAGQLAAHHHIPTSKATAHLTPRPSPCPPQEPHHFHSKVLTGPKIASLVPTLADTLNSGEAILPRSAYASLLELEAARVQASYLAKLNTVGGAVGAAEGGGTGVMSLVNQARCGMMAGLVDSQALEGVKKEAEKTPISSAKLRAKLDKEVDELKVRCLICSVCGSRRGRC